MSCCDRYVLRIACLVRYRPGVDHGAESCSPEHFPVTGVERIKEPFTSSAEQKIGRGGKESTIGNVVHFELPFFLAGFRIDGQKGSVTILQRRRLDWTALQHGNSGPRIASEERPPFLVFSRALGEDGKIVGPRRDVKKPGSRAEGR